MKLNLKLLEKNIDAIADYDFENKKIFGSAYYVYQADNLEFEKCYGTLSKKSDISVTNKTLFRLASMTKPITAIATLILVDRNLINLDDKVSKYLPELKDLHIFDDNGNDLGLPRNIPTIRNILSHSSGMGSSGEKLSKMKDEDMESIDSYIRFLCKTGLDFEPGTMQQYSGTGAFDVLTKIIEIVSEIDFLSFLKKEIFTPCNMPDTTFVMSDNQKERLAAMHNRVDGKNEEFVMPEGCVFENFPSTHFLGGAGLVSNLHDYSNFAKMLLNGGEINGKTLLSKNTFRQLCTEQFPNYHLESWGLGVRIIVDSSSALPINCFGWSGAYGSHFWIDPVNKIFAVFMKNSMVDGGAGNESAVNFEKAVYSSLA